MRAVVGKLKDRSGASMIIALVFFLVCAMVGGVILTAASANVGRMARERLASQRRLAVTSAAQLIAGDLRDTEFRGVYCRVETVTTTIHTTPGADGEEDVTSTSVARDEKTEKAPEKTGFFGSSSLLKISALPGISQLYYSKLAAENVGGIADAPPAEPIACRLSFGAMEEQGIPAVEGVLEIDQEYGVTVLLSDEEGGSRLTMTFAPVVSLPVTSTETRNEEAADSATKTTSTYYTTTVTWDEPVITGGGQ